MSSFSSKKSFSDVEGLPRCAKDALAKSFGYTYMSAAQAMYMQAVVNGQDMLVRAGTGSGKTLGFLLPVITALMLDWNSGKKRQVAVILSPARELAEQTLEQAKQFASSCGLIAQGLIGGVRTSKKDVSAMKSSFDVHIIVATPGRLMDHLKNTSGFSAMLSERGRVLVLDEVDRLLDPGFKPAMLQASQVMSSPSRQTLLFTATATKAVREASRELMRGDDAFIDAGSTNAAGDSGAAHNANVTQEAELLPPHLLLPELIRVLRMELKGHTVIFVQTAMTAKLITPIISRLMQGSHTVLQIHSRMNQSQRNHAVRDFTASKKPAVMIATDVFARGIDVKNVSLVLQLGIAPDNAQVAHRAGRTGRGGATGRSLMLLADNERAVLEDLISREKMPISVVKSPIGPGDDAEVSRVVLELSRGPEFKRASCSAFIASIGFYKSHVKRLKWVDSDLVPNVAHLFKPLGVSAPAVCPVPARTVKKMGLKAGHGLTLT